MPEQSSVALRSSSPGVNEVEVLIVLGKDDKPKSGGNREYLRCSCTLDVCYTFTYYYADSLGVPVEVRFLISFATGSKHLRLKMSNFSLCANVG